MNASHAQKVAAVARAMRDFWERKQPVQIYHGSTNSTRPYHLKENEVVDVSDFKNVVVDAQTSTAQVEPNVPMDALVDATLRHGFLPLVVPEFPGITVGGAIQGGAGESSSFKYGAVHDTCLEHEMVLGNGEIVTVSPKNNPELFYGTACSYGTLGVITKTTLRLQPAHRYVHLTYIRTKTANQTIDRVVKEMKRQDLDFVDGIQFSPDHGVVMTGVYADTPLRNRARFSRAWDEWFYLHAQTVSERSAEYTESIPVKDYFFRYDRAAFWSGPYVFSFLKIPFNRLTRWLFNPYVHTRKIYQIMHASGVSQRFIVQDICLPEKTVRQFVDYVDDTFTIYPLWFCPLKTSPSKLDRLSPGLVAGDVLVNVGVWGPHPKPYDEFVQANRAMEAEVQRLGGRKVLYAHAYYLEKDFWQVYDKKWYDAIRTKYHADVAFPSIYKKVVVKERQRVSRKKLLQALLASPFKLRR